MHWTAMTDVPPTRGACAQTRAGEQAARCYATGATIRESMAKHAELIAAFTTATQSGDLERLIKMLTDDVRVLVDGGGKLRAATESSKAQPRSATDDRSNPEASGFLVARRLHDAICDHQRLAGPRGGVARGTCSDRRIRTRWRPCPDPIRNAQSRKAAPPGRGMTGTTTEPTRLMTDTAHKPTSAQMNRQSDEPSLPAIASDRREFVNARRIRSSGSSVPAGDGLSVSRESHQWRYGAG